jgi:hypothetical protein
MAEEEARKLGARKMVLDVGSENLSALFFYSKLGFKIREEYKIPFNGSPGFCFERMEKGFRSKGFGASLQPPAGEDFYYEPNYHYQGFKENFPKKLSGVIVPYGNNSMQLKGLVEFSLFRESSVLYKTLIAEPLCP